jgi:hypothetical protein
MATAKNAGDTGEIVIRDIKRSTMKVKVIGTSPLILNRMSQKAMHELLAPRKKTAADRANNLKHQPLQEFRDSPYLIADPNAPTLIGVMASGFKKAMATAAMRVGGAKKTEISQLVYVPGELINVYGLPRVFLSITRSADMARTPDVRTRAIIPHWAIELPVTWVDGTLNQTSLLNLLNAAGFVCGVGDWRQEKGSGSFGSFTLVSEENEAEFERIKAEGGRMAQQAALDTPVAYDAESAELLTWFEAEIKARGDQGKQTSGAAADGEAKPKRGRKPAAPALNGHANANGAALPQ